MRILAVDPGSKRIGLAVSDPTGTIARPLMVVAHTSRPADAAVVATQAAEQGAGLILVGQSFDEQGNLTSSGRQAARFAEALRQQTSTPIVFWDEAFTTREARASRIAMHVSRRKRAGHLDAVAATLLLQSYLENNPPTDGRK